MKVPAEQLANGAKTTLNGAINNSVTSITITSATNYPTSGYFSIIIDTEIILVKAISGTTLTVLRGQEGTTAASHVDLSDVVVIETVRSVQAILADSIVDNGNNKGQEIWLMATHQSIDQNIYLLGSVDGINFQYLRKTSVNKQSYATRDPSIIKYRGVYYIAFTNAGNIYFTIYKSLDLWNWTFLVNVDCSAARSNVYHVWAPQWFYDSTDDSLMIIHSLSHDTDDTNHQLYYTIPTASDLSTWAVPATIGGGTWPASSIDPCLVLNGSTYTLYFKNDISGHRYIEYATSSSKVSGYTVQTTDDALGFGINNEAPELHQVDTTTWRLYYNNVSGLNSVQYYYRETTSFPTGWGSANPVVAPFIPAHSGLIRVKDVPTARNILANFISGNLTNGSRVLRTTNQSIANTTGTAISFDTIDRDDLNAWNSGTQLMAPHSGWYLLGSHVKWDAATGGKRVSDVRINGTNYVASASITTPSDANDPDVIASTPVWLNTGDYFETTVFQNQGSSVNVTAAQMFMIEL